MPHLTTSMPCVSTAASTYGETGGPAVSNQVSGRATVKPVEESARRASAEVVGVSTLEAYRT